METDSTEVLTLYDRGLQDPSCDRALPLLRLPSPAGHARALERSGC
jgi:hypothetical protein